MVISLREKEGAEKEKEESAHLCHSIRIPQVLALGQGQLVVSQASKPYCLPLVLPHCVQVGRHSCTSPGSVVISSDIIFPSSYPTLN